MREREREEPTMSERGHAGGEAALHSEKVSAAQLQLYLKGIDYPANKRKVLDTARSNNAPQNVMGYLNRLPEREYKSPVVIEQEFSKLK